MKAITSIKKAVANVTAKMKAMSFVDGMIFAVLFMYSINMVDDLIRGHWARAFFDGVVVALFAPSFKKSYVATVVKDGENEA